MDSSSVQLTTITTSKKEKRKKERKKERNLKFKSQSIWNLKRERQRERQRQSYSTKHRKSVEDWDRAAPISPPRASCSIIGYRRAGRTDQVARHWLAGDWRLPITVHHVQYVSIGQIGMSACFLPRKSSLSLSLSYTHTRSLSWDSWLVVVVLLVLASRDSPLSLSQIHFFFVCCWTA